MDLALNNVKRLICHETNQPTNRPTKLSGTVFLKENELLHQEGSILEDSTKKRVVFNLKKKAQIIPEGVSSWCNG